MFGPPCPQCSSCYLWLPGKDGEACECGWPRSGSSPLEPPKPMGGLTPTAYYNLAATIATIVDQGGDYYIQHERGYWLRAAKGCRGTLHYHVSNQVPLSITNPSS